MALSSDTRFGVYEITALIGAGGMGEVYRARDSRLNRDVALKVLPDAFAIDPDRVGRFKREAQVLASLNHPNIAAIYGFEEGALVLELVEGPTLADRIAEGPLPLDEALPIARQIADALEAAHEHGVIHRDLKPANIKLRPDGTVKVLDFGLAKAMDPAASAVAAGVGRIDVTASPTITSPAATRIGMILGTAAYMSPEQARGKPVDKRSDIWAFGCVLYEMLTGTRAFGGNEITDTLAFVITKDIDWSKLPAPTPPGIRRLMRRCLDKDPRNRLRDIGDARFELFDLNPALAERAIADDSRRRSRGRLVLYAVVAVAACAAAGVAYFSPASTPTTAVAARVQIPLPPGVHLAADTNHPTLALAPDASQLAFVGHDGRERRLYVRALAGDSAKAVPGTEGAASPFYSPDGAWIAFFDGSVLKKVPAQGGVPLTVHASTGISVNRGATWTAEDTVVYAGSPNSGLSRGAVADDEPGAIGDWTWLTDNTRPYAWPHALPGGRSVLFTDNTAARPEEARVALLSLATGEIRNLIAGGTNPRYSSTGHVLFARGSTLHAIAVDGNFEPAGREQRLIDGVMTAPNGAAHFAVAANGTLAYVAGTAMPRQHELVWVDRGGRTETLLDDGRVYEDVRLSPDGTRLAFTSAEGANFDVWVRDLARGSMTRVTAHPGEDFEPVWSPDGTRLAFASEIGEDPENPGPALAWITGFGARPEQLLRTPGFGNWEFPLAWSPDGAWIVYATTTGGTGRDIVLLPTTGPRQPVTFVATPADEAGATFSPDGRWLAYMSDETGQPEIYVRPFPGPGAAVAVSAGGGVEPRWSRDGRELFYRAGNAMMAVKFGSGSVLSAGPPQLLFEGQFEMKGYGGSSANYDVAQDGRFIMVRRKNPLTPTVIHVIFNWPRALGVQ